MQSHIIHLIEPIKFSHLNWSSALLLQILVSITLYKYWFAEGFVRAAPQLQGNKSVKRILVRVKSTLKMHNDFRDVAIQISTSSKVELKFLITSGIGLQDNTETPNVVRHSLSGSTLRNLATADALLNGSKNLKKFKISVGF